MTPQEFIAVSLEKLDKGRIEMNGEFYYNMESILTLFEWYEKEHLQIQTKKVNTSLRNIIEIISKIPRA